MQQFWKYLIPVSILFLLSSCYRERRPIPQPRVVSFVDEFNNNRNGWEFVDRHAQAYGYISSGTFKFDFLSDYYDAYYTAQNIGFNRFDDFTVYTRIGSDNNTGLLIGSNVEKQVYGYTFMVDYDGYFAVYDEGGNGYGNDVYELVPKQTRSFIRDRGQWNELVFEKRGSRWIGYINGYEVFNIPAQNIHYSTVGFANVPFTQADADYIQVDWLE